MLVSPCIFVEGNSDLATVMAAGLVTMLLQDNHGPRISVPHHRGYSVARSLGGYGFGTTIGGHGIGHALAGLLAPRSSFGGMGMLLPILKGLMS